MHCDFELGFILIFCVLLRFHVSMHYVEERYAATKVQLGYVPHISFRYRIPLGLARKNKSQKCKNANLRFPEWTF